MQTTNYQLNEAKMFADITDGTAIVINSSTGVYYGMNAFGTAVFENLTSGSSVNDILEAVKSLPGTPEDFPARLNSFISILAEYEIVIPAEASAKEATIDASVAATDGFNPECTEYKDVQELLYADPIHDVEEDKGWSPE